MAESINPNASLLDRQKVMDSKNCICDCGSQTFVRGFVIKKISPIYSGTGEEEIMPIPVMLCSKCGTVLKETASKPEYAGLLTKIEKED